MRPYARSDEKKILNERLKDFMEEVIPVDLLPYLTCLQQTDKEDIEATQNNKGPTTANQTLVDRLKRRDKGFSHFVRALRQTGNEQTALLVDPYYLYPSKRSPGPRDDWTAVLRSSGKVREITEFRQLLHVLKAKEQREILGITPASVVDVKWPTVRCKALVENVVLYDTQGIGERKATDDVVIELCQFENLDEGDDEVAVPDGSGIGYKRIGTAIGAEITTDDIKDRCVAEFMTTVSVRGKIFFLDSQTQREAKRYPLQQNEAFTSDERETEGSRGLKEFELNLVEAAKGALKFETLKYDMQAFIAKAKEDSATDDDDGSVPEVEEEIEIPPVYLGTKANPFNVCELELREYQKELAAPALEGKNTIICAPTNSGKTYVAIEIAKNHLELFKAEAPTESSRRKRPKVVFIVSTVNLVSQQKERFELYLRDKYSVADISGANTMEIPLKYLLQSHDIIVLTAQILVNALNSKTKEEQVNLEDISLLLFDECHHAHKEHSYNRIMETYLALKKQPRKQGPLPQQKERFELYLRDKYSVADISGANTMEIPLKYLLQSHDIIVLTAQILVNALNSKTKEEQVNLEDISLLLFDECHHAHKEHSYNRIMETYLALKKQPRKQGPLPQVVGFTASLGTGKAKSVQKAEEHILLVSANLDAEVISTVRKNQSELKKFAKVPERNVHQVSTTGKDPFEKIISQVMKRIEAKVKGRKGEESTSVPQDDNKACQQYRQWVEELSKSAVADADRYLITFAEHLREYHIALTINKSTTLKNAKKRLEKYFKSLDREKFLPIDKTLERLFQCAMELLDKNVEEHGEPENPFLMKLKELLLQHYKEVTPQKREKVDHSSNGKADSENDTAKKCNDGCMEGESLEAGASSRDSEKRREEDAKSGKEDKANGGNPEEHAKVVTAQEYSTHDREERELPSTYEYTIKDTMKLSELSTEGNLADEGMYSVLVSEDSGALKRENTNRFRETLMVEALSKVQNISTNDFQRKVKAIQDKNFRDRKLKKGVMASKKSKPVPDDVTLHCRKCNAAVCQAHDIRRVRETYYVIISSDVRESKVVLKNYPSPKKIDDVEFNKKIYCKKCGQDWGVSVRINEVEWLCIKIASFVVQFPGPNPQRIMKKKWKDLPFSVEEATFEELWQQAEHEEQDCIEDDLSDLLD
ncbi:putative ATP-dependent RNA helicase DDX58 [Stylophora pistillata]|uniref:RNA helicase n=1 Tax=Stylophora pistillata TaxID=50429 RepID=A0A2B4RGN7_STYPI|nr:putative ATP-dependent RNA helicase DDX58 [Stylophora pistillata]